MEVFGLEAEESRVLCRDPVDLIKGAKEASTFEVTLICTIRVCELDEKRRRERKTTTTLLAIFPALTHHHCHHRNSTLHHPRLPPVNSAHCETRLLPRCWRVLFPGIAAFADRAPPGSARRQQHVALLYPRLDLRPPPPSSDPRTPPPSISPATRAAMSTATANGDASSKGAPPASKQQFKPGGAGKALDGARKQADSPVDAQNRSVTPNKTTAGATSTAASPCVRAALAHPRPDLAPCNCLLVCLAALVVYFGHALTLHLCRITSQHTSDADNARKQKADTYTTEGLDWHQPHHTATDQLAQPRQWLRQVSTQVPISITAERTRRLVVR